MPDRNDWHNKRTADFVDIIGGEALQNGGGYAAMMTVTESAMLATMLVNVRVFGLQPHVSAGLMESAMQRALERFTDQMKRNA